MAVTDWFKLDQVATLWAAIDAYYDVHPTGGSLHVVLDDQNWRRGDVEFCASYAAEAADLIGEAIARTLLKIPEDIFALAETGDGESLNRILDAWEERIILDDRRARGVTHLVTVNGSWHVCEHLSKAEAKADFDYRVAAANEEENVSRSYKIELSPLGEAPILSYDKPAATHWRKQPGAQAT